MYVLAFILLGMSLLIILPGYLIRFKHKVEIIAGYDPKRVKDKAGLAKWVGSNLLALGFIGLVTTAIAFAYPSIALAFFFCYIGIIIIGVFITTFQGGKFYSAD